MRRSFFMLTMITFGSLLSQKAKPRILNIMTGRGSWQDLKNDLLKPSTLGGTVITALVLASREQIREKTGGEWFFVAWLWAEVAKQIGSFTIASLTPYDIAMTPAVDQLLLSTVFSVIFLAVTYVGERVLPKESVGAHLSWLLYLCGTLTVIQMWPV